MLPIKRHWPHISPATATNLDALRRLDLTKSAIRGDLREKFPSLVRGFSQSLGAESRIDRLACQSVLSEIGNTLILDCIATHQDPAHWIDMVQQALAAPPKQPFIGEDENPLIDLAAPILLTPNSLPQRWLELCHGIAFEDGLTLGAFLTQNIAQITFVPAHHLPIAGGRILHGQAFPLWREAMVRISPEITKPLDMLQALAFMAHEACHLYLFWNLVADNPLIALDPEFQETRAHRVERSILEAGGRLLYQDGCISESDWKLSLQHWDEKKPCNQ